MPPRCVLNGLKVVEVPNKLAKLDCLSRQFIQRAKAYQTVVRLGTYTNKVPVYNSLKAYKGNMFFLPLPMHKTMETLDDVEEAEVALSNPELYIIVNCKPTKDKVVWRSLVDVNDIKVALTKLKETNWLYQMLMTHLLMKCLKRLLKWSARLQVLCLKRPLTMM